MTGSSTLLTTCCMQAAIEEKKRVLAEKAATLRRTLGRSKGDTLDPLDDSSLSRSAKVHPCRPCHLPVAVQYCMSHEG